MLRWIVTYLVSCFAMVAYLAMPDIGEGLDLQIEADSAAVLEAADQASAQRGRAGEDYRTAVVFQSSADDVRFVQMSEGVEGLQRHMEDDHLVPWTWCARHFREGEAQEYKTCFRPDGRLLAWDDRVPEDAPGAALDVDAARARAHAALTETLSMDLDRWVEVEHEEEARDSGRIDHAFAWKLKDVSISGAEPRLSVEVQGDQVTEVWRWLDTPTAFEDDYERMRTANQALSMPGTAWYGLGASLVAIVLLVRARRERTEWRAPLKLGMLIGSGMGLAAIAAIPQAAYSYDTATSWNTTLGMVAAGAVMVSILIGLKVALAAAGFHVVAKQWRPDDLAWWALARPEIWGTEVFLRKFALGMGMSAVMLYYVTGLYWVFGQWGWYMPVGVQDDPSILGSWAPWLSPLAMAHMAGINEELEFRGLMLAVVAIWATGRKHEKKWLWLALLVQALVFASAHATYPQQPSYTRIVEMTPTWFFLGWLTLRIGLLPLAVCHVAFDLVLMASPLLAAGAYGQWAMVMSVLFWPLGLFGLAHARGWSPQTLPESATWAGWQPQSFQFQVQTTPARYPRGLWAVACVLALFGAFERVWEISADWTRPVYTMTRTEAIERSADKLKAKDVDLGDRTPIVKRYRSSWTDTHEYASEVAPEEYAALVQHAEGPLSGPGYSVYWNTWGVRDAWRVRLLPHGDETQTFARHLVDDDEPDAADVTEEGVRLARAEALARCTDELVDTLWMPADKLELLEASQTERTDRRDWVLVFRDTTWSTLDVRARCTLEGDAFFWRTFIEIPEAWEREQRAEEQAETTRSLGAIPGVFVLVAGMVSMVRRGGRGLRFPTWAIAVGILWVFAVVDACNTWPSKLSGFDQIRDLLPQVGMAVLTAAFVASGAAMFKGTGLWLAWATTPSSNRAIHPVLVGLVAACAVLAPDGLMDLWNLWSGSPDTEIRTPSMSIVLSWSPVLAVMLTSFTGWTTSLFVVGLTVSAMRWRGWVGQVAIVLYATTSIARSGEWVDGLEVVAMVLMSFCPAAIPWYAMWNILPMRLHEAIYPHAPGVRAGALLSMVVVVGLAWAMHRIWPTQEGDHDTAVG